MVAKELGGTVECTLRSPIPLEVPLEFEPKQTGARLRYGAKVVIEAEPTMIDVAPPPPISTGTAMAAMAGSPALDPRHPFPTCFVCGPGRSRDDGLRIFPAALDGKLHVAAWTPSAEFGDSQHRLQPEFLWAAMDCPTGFASGFPLVGKLVTGRLAVQQLADILTETSCVLMAWPLGVEGRKHFSAACLYQDQKLRAVARATWIRLES